MSYGSGIKYLPGQGYQTNRLGIEVGGGRGWRGVEGHTKIGKTMCIALLPLTEILLNTVEALVSRHPQNVKKLSVNAAGHLQVWFSGPL